MNILVFGPNGSGKGTQGAVVQKKYNISHIESGVIFRENIKKGSELGKKAKEFIDRGELVPDNITIPMILDRLKQETAKAGLAWRKVEAFGQSYAETLAEWARRFQAKWSDIRAMGFDERFKQLWLFYLGYCEAGFRTGRTDVVQLELAKPA